MTSPADFGFNLLPPDPGVISPDLALDAALAPVVDLGPAPVLPLGKGWAFDFLARQFVRPGGSPGAVYELDNLRIWIEKTLRTARYAHPIYTDAYGTEDPFRLVGRPFEGALVAAYQESVVEALTVHDRIAAVGSFYYQQDPFDDGLYVSFTVTLDAEAEQTIQVDSFPVTPPWNWTPR